MERSFSDSPTRPYLILYLTLLPTRLECVNLLPSRFAIPPRPSPTVRADLEAPSFHEAPLCLRQFIQSSLWRVGIRRAR